MVVTDSAPTDRQILEFESRFYRHAGAKATAIRDELGLGQVAYWQRLRSVVLAPPAELAIEFGPLINRCQRRMGARVHQRPA